MQDSLDEFAKQLFGISNTDACKQLLCVFCRKKVDPAKMSTDMHRREWEISGVCETCQDETFGKDK
jgi:hypothetical protein